MNSIIKLTNGETIIAEIVHQDETTTSVLEPLLLDIGESESGRPMMVAMTWIPLTKSINMVNLSTSHVVAIADVDEDINAYYIRSLAVLKENRQLDDQDEVLDEYMDMDEVNSGILEQKISANTVH
jgi:hypothetical protein